MLHHNNLILRSILTGLIALSWSAALAPAHAADGAEKVAQKEVPQISQATRDEIKALTKEAVETARGGKFKEAVAPAEAALKKSEDAFGKDHFEVSRVLEPLAMIYTRLERHEDAEKTYLRMIPILGRVYGIKTTQVARVREQLAETYVALGRKDKALAELETSVAIKRVVLGPNNVALGMSLNKLAEFYVEDDKTTDAVPLWEQSLGIFQRVLSDRHPNFRFTREKLVAAYRDAGDDAKADALLDE